MVLGVQLIAVMLGVQFRRSLLLLLRMCTAPLCLPTHPTPILPPTHPVEEEVEVDLEVPQPMLALLCQRILDKG